MIIKRIIYHLLIFFILVSFGFFGSLSHIFTLSLIVLVVIDYIQSRNRKKIEYKAITLYFFLTGSFFIFLLTSIFYDNIQTSLIALGPMYPLPLIGLLVVTQNSSSFSLRSEILEQISQFSVLFAFLIYLILTNFKPPGIQYDLYGRIMLFSGNPIPFSFTMLGISIFCLSDWHNSNWPKKLKSLLVFAIGIYLASFLSGARSTLLVIVFVGPIIVLYLSKNWKQGAILILLMALAVIVLIHFIDGTDIQSQYLKRIINGYATLQTLKSYDGSTTLRIQMWVASLEAISHRPFFGYNITERFGAISPFLPSSFPGSFTHPHNDIFAGMISSGFLGGITALFSFTGTSLAAVLSKPRCTTKIYFGILLTCTAFIFANINTVFFNDITCAWLAFSTYLIWSTKFRQIN